MCGIGFMVNYGSKNYDVDELHGMWREMSARGTDACGYYFEREDGTKRMIKLPFTSDEALMEINSNERMEKWRLDGTEKLVMLHTRAQTQGSSTDNNNNMPIFSKHFVLVHNGVITTPFDKDRYPYRGVVDSEEILARVEMSGWKKGLAALSGSLAIAMKPFNGRSLYVFKSSNPLDMVFNKQGSILWGCSVARYAPYGQGESLQDSVFNPQCSVVGIERNTLFKVSLHRKEIRRICEITQPTTSYTRFANGKQEIYQ